MEKTIVQVQDYLVKNELDLALNKLRSVFSIADSELVNDVIILSGQLKKLKSDVRIGVIDYAQETLGHNKIMAAILSLMDELKNEPERFERFDKTEHQLDQSIKEKGKEALPIQLKDALFERMAYVKGNGLKIKVIWIDEFPGNNIYESRVLESIGVEIVATKSSGEAAQLLKNNTYDIILSNISRAGQPDEGLRFHRALVEKGIDLPIIFYVGSVDRQKGVPPFAFGITDLPNDLIHLVLDVIERKY